MQTQCWLWSYLFLCLRSFQSKNTFSSVEKNLERRLKSFKMHTAISLFQCCDEGHFFSLLLPTVSKGGTNVHPDHLPKQRTEKLRLQHTQRECNNIFIQGNIKVFIIFSPLYKAFQWVKKKVEGVWYGQAKCKLISSKKNGLSASSGIEKLSI